MRKLVWMLLLGACAGRSPETSPERAAPTAAPPVAAPAPEAPVVLAADTPSATAAGHTFTAPAGWSMARADDRVTLTAPEGDVTVALVEVGAADAEAAAAAAWQAYRPDAGHPVRLATRQPGRHGWDEQRRITYETSAAQALAISVVARRRGDTWVVMIVDATRQGAERRSGQVLTIERSLRPAGYQPESFAGATARPLDAARIGELRAFLEDARTQLDIPGIAFALIQGGEIVHVEGLGVRELGKKARVDGDTLFAIASNTKPLTTLLLARLVDAGTLRWDMPVTEAFPRFRLGDDETTRQVQVRHLLCACTGLPRNDYVWVHEYARLTADDVFAALAASQPTARLGEVYQYSNPMAAAAGLIAGHLLHPDLAMDAAYRRAMREQIFAPLGMTSATFDFDRARKAKNRAGGHGVDLRTGRNVEADAEPNRAAAGPYAPAGGAWTSARDLARYVQLELARGVLPDGTRLISEENLLARRARQVAMSDTLHYGMGLRVDTGPGVTVVRHGGSLTGYQGDLWWLPEHDVGAVMLTNADSGELLRPHFQRRLLEVVFDGKAEAAEDLAASAEAWRADLAATAARHAIPADATAAAALAERYRSDRLGELRVRREGGRLIFDFGEWRSEVASRHNADGTITFATIDPGMDGGELVAGERDGQRVLLMREAQVEYVFVEE